MITFSKIRNTRNGFTLVELLVAISILTIVTAIIPRLRIVNKDRNIRETVRVAGSVFSSARDRALGAGSSGVIIERNLRFSSSTSNMGRVYYAGTRLYQMRPLPPYTGDSRTDFAFAVQTNDANGDPVIRCFIPMPFEHDPANGRSLFRRGDSIRFGNRLPLLIKDVLDPITITFDFGGMMPPQINSKNFSSGSTLVMLPLDLAFDNDSNPNNQIVTLAPDLVTNRVPPKITSFPTSGNITGPYPVGNLNFEADFEIQRMRKLESSVVDLPSGYLIDLRYSGPLDSANFDGDPDTFTALGLSLGPTADETTLDNREIQVHFDSKGSISQLIFNGNTVLAGQSLYFFVNEYDPNLQADVQATAAILLANPSSLWLTIGINGGANIGYNAPPVIGPVGTMISEARNISRSRTAANQ